MRKKSFQPFMLIICLLIGLIFESQWCHRRKSSFALVYIIDIDSKIIYRYFDVDYRNRASVKEITDHL